MWQERKAAAVDKAEAVHIPAASAVATVMVTTPEGLAARATVMNIILLR